MSIRKTVRSDIRRTVLPSGLRVVSEAIPTLRSTAYGVWVNVGSRDEGPTVAGASHFLEHLLFKGTKTRSAMDISSSIEAVGGETNAFTSKENTCFYARTLDNDLPVAIDVISDLITSSVIRESDVVAERGVVLEEIAMRDDDPGDLIHDLFAETLFGQSPIGKPILGTVESIQSMSRDAIYRYYRKKYRPENLVVAVAGNLKHDLVLEQIESAFDRDNFSEQKAVPSIKRGAKRIKPSGVGEVRLVHRKSEQAHIMVGCEGVSREDDRRFALAILSTALGGGMSSRLFQEIREKRGLAYSVYAFPQQFAGSGMFSIYAGTTPTKALEVVQLIRENLENIKSHGLTQEEIARAKGQAKGALVLGMEDTGSRMSRLGKSELMYGNQKSVDELLEEIDAVSSESIKALSSQLLSNKMSMTIIGPFSGKNQGQFDRALA